MVYFNGYINGDDWNYQQWEGYETEALNRYGIEFMEEAGDDPFCLFLSPHQPHYTPFEYAPKSYYERLPASLKIPENVSEVWHQKAGEMYRHYLAMVLALDDMVGGILDYLDRSGKADNTMVVFTSDHGTQLGTHGIHPWEKRHPFEDSMKVPLIMRFPDVLHGGIRRDTLTAPVDFFPSLCSLFGIPIPRSVEGYDLSEAWKGLPGAFEQEAVLTMNFSLAYDWFVDGLEWRGVRTKRHSYARWLNGREVLFDLEEDPLEMKNLVEDPRHRDLYQQMETLMKSLQQNRGDELVPCTQWKNWLDSQRRVIRNAFGPLSHPEEEPDWSLLE